MDDFGMHSGHLSILSHSSISTSLFPLPASLSQGNDGKIFFQDIATRYLNCANALSEMKCRLEIEMLEFFEKNYLRFPDVLFVGNSFLNKEFIQEMFDSIFSSKVDSLYLLLREIFTTEFPMTTREIEKLSTKSMLLQTFGDMIPGYLNSSRQMVDAVGFVDRYYSRSQCNRCLKQTCHFCRHLYAYFISRYWKMRNQSKEIYRVVVEDLFLKTYILFVSQKQKDLSSFYLLKSFLASHRSGESGYTQLDFIELFLLGKFIIDGRLSPVVEPSTERNRGHLRSYLLTSGIFDTSFFDNIPQRLPEECSTNPLLSTTSVELKDGGCKTRSSAPFLPPPPPHNYEKFGFESRLSEEHQDLISLIRNNTDCLDKLVEPYCKTMSDLPGGVHSSTTQTVIAMVEKLQMIPSQSCWIDVGCGAPIMALQGSLFNKLTLAIDLPPVMRLILQILHLMPPELRVLAESIYLQEGDILHLNRHSIPNEIAESVTHVTNFIGTDEANDATVRFALSNFLPTLKYLCVRGRYSRELEEILAGYGFIRDNNASFSMSLKSSSTHRRKRVTTYVKKTEGIFPSPNLSLIHSPKERVSIVLGLSRVSDITAATDPQVRSQYFRAQVAEYYFHKVLYVSFLEEQVLETEHHPHTVFLPRSVDSNHSFFQELKNYEVDRIETDFETEVNFMSLFILFSSYLMDGGKVVYLKTKSSLARTLENENEWLSHFKVGLSPIGSASHYYTGIVQSESALRELVPNYTSLNEKLKTKSDGLNEAIVLQKSDNLNINQRYWKTFRELYALPARRPTDKKRKMTIPETSPNSPTSSNSQTDPESPLSSEDSDLFEDPSPFKKDSLDRKRVGNEIEGMRQVTAAAGTAATATAAEEEEVIDLTGDSLDFAKKFKKSLHKRGRVKLILLGEDNVPFTYFIPSSDSEPDAFDETTGPWSHLDSNIHEI